MRRLSKTAIDDGLELQNDDFFHFWANFEAVSLPRKSI